MTDRKVIWSNPDIRLNRVGTSYEIQVELFVGQSATALSRDELRQLFLAMKKELGLAGD